MRILDLGGAISYWEALRPLWEGRDLRITIINNNGVNQAFPPHYIQRHGDACSLPEFADISFDIVHSNSVLEHVGDWDRMSMMAGECRRLAPHHFVQTPNFWFPFEPHDTMPLVHYLPVRVRADLLVRKQRGFLKRCGSHEEAVRMVSEIRLLTAGQMHQLFPCSQIRRERLVGLTKSLVAIR